MSQDDGGDPKTALIPRATVEEVVAYRNKAIELYGEAFTAIEAADKAMKAAHAMASQAAGGAEIYVSRARPILFYLPGILLPFRRRLSFLYGKIR